MRKVAFYALWAFVATIPMEIIAMIEGIGSLSRLVGVLAFGLGALAMLLRREVRRFRGFLVLAALFVGWSLFSGLWAVDVSRAGVKATSYAQLFLMTWLIYEFARTPDQVRRLLQAYVAGAVVTMYFNLSLYFEAASRSAYMIRYSAFDADPNRTALIIALAIPMAVYLMVHAEKPIAKWLYGAVVPVAVAANVLTGSKSGAIATVVALTILPLVVTRLSWKQRALAIFCIGAIGLAVVSFADTSAFNRITRMKEVAGGKGDIRLQIWEAGLQAFEEHPLVGVGGGGFRIYLSQHSMLNHGEGFVAHNTFLSVLAELGIVGFVLWMALLALLGVQATRMPVMDRRLCLVLLLTWSASVFFITQEHKKHTWFVFSVVGTFAAAQASRRAGGADRPVQAAPRYALSASS